MALPQAWAQSEPEPAAKQAPEQAPTLLDQFVQARDAASIERLMQQNPALVTAETVDKMLEAARAARERKELDVAFQMATQAAKVAETLPQKRSLGQCYILRAEIHTEREQAPAAAQDALRAARLFDQSGSLSDKAGALTTAGHSFLHVNDVRRAVEQYTAAFAVKDVGSKRSLSPMFSEGNIGWLLDRVRDRDRPESREDALLLCDLTVKMADDLKAPAVLVQALALQGRLREQMKDTAGALDSFRRGAHLEKTNDAAMNLYLFERIGNAQLQVQSYGAAQYALRRAVGWVEKLRAQTPDLPSRLDLVEQHHNLYRQWAVALIAQKRPLEAFVASELGRGRGLLDELKGGHPSFQSVLSPQERAEDARLRAAFVQMAQERDALYAVDLQGNPDQTQSAALDQREEALKKVLITFRRGVLKAHPQASPSPATIAPADLAKGICASVFKGSFDTTLISYMVFEDSVYAFVVAPQERPRSKKGYLALDDEPLVEAVRLPMPYSQITQLATDFRSRCVNPSYSYREVGRQLHQVLLSPLKIQGHFYRNRAKYISIPGEKDYVVIVPDGSLSSLPFQALVDESGRHMIEDYALSYAPSAACLVALEQRAQRRHPISEAVTGSGALKQSFFLAGNPKMPLGVIPLPDARVEVAALADYYGAQFLTGERANETNVLSGMGQADVLCLSTHGSSDDQDSNFSHLILARDEMNDGRLCAWEISQTRLRADLFFLSACNTAKGPFTQGEGAMGLPYAFLEAGASSGVVTQWVSTTGSVEFSVDAMHLMVGPDASAAFAPNKAQALRKALLRFMHDGSHGHPFHWATFILIGAS